VSQIRYFLIFVSPKYGEYGFFAPFPDTPRRLFMRMETIAELLDKFFPQANPTFDDSGISRWCLRGRARNCRIQVFSIFCEGCD
jgi:hypothetical protein